MVEVEKKQCYKCRGQMTTLLVMDALPIGNNGQMIMKKQLGSCGGNMGKNIGEKRKHTIKNTTGRKGRKYSVKRVKGKVKTCNWLRHLRTRKHRYGMIWNDMELNMEVVGNLLLKVAQVDYLRDLGALDEARHGRVPSVVVSNYVLGASNCIGTSRFYAQCCVDPCDQLMVTW